MVAVTQASHMIEWMSSGMGPATGSTGRMHKDNHESGV